MARPVRRLVRVGWSAAELTSAGWALAPGSSGQCLHLAEVGGVRGAGADPRQEEAEVPPLPPGATLGISLGTDDVFARRVVLLDLETQRLLEAPWDTLAPLPLGDGQVWLLWRCPGNDEARRLELIAWTPRDGRSRGLGLLAGDVRQSCEQASAAEELRVMTFPDGGVKTPQGWQSYEYVPAVVPSGTGAFARMVSDGGAAWVFVDAKGRSDDASIPLTPSLGGGFALYRGFLFTDEGVFRWPRGEPPPRVVAAPEEGSGSDGGQDASGTP
ncbi:hypothetical protein [Pyxidicoccus sp. MSG2]|uniref:hypothetical protein n=1 Tax=Pyxidicoccus sp. MSG2 TaxID=2996790 RepID=UPI002271B79D|nr:hypothetical protein [Pyxidicoccus sp. MSG2]MCY1022369.1 hypothetical protein [Pyxidicoccus sp. MSG2]